VSLDHIISFNSIYEAEKVALHLITKTQADQIEAIQKRAVRIIYTCTHDMPYLSATFVADLPIYVRPQGSTVQKIFEFHSTAYFPSTQSSSSPSRPTTHHSPMSSLKIPPYPHQNKKVSVLSLVCPSPLSDLTISSPNHYDCIVLIIVLYYCVLLFYYCILFSPLFCLMATIF